jgi:diacylglycerol kinase family enzyme
MRIVVLLNAAAGTRPANEADEEERTIRAAFADAGAPHVEIKRVPGNKLTPTAAALAKEGGDQITVVAAGGDGTQSAIASALAGGDTPMGVIPKGTLNHFAKDLGVPLEIPEAARLIVTGRPRPIDVGEVNDRIFVNNSSIGLYPQVVRHRDKVQEQLGHGKWYAMLLAIIAIFRRFPLVRLRLIVNGETWLRTTPFVFVGNNQYQIERLQLGQRTSLEKGDLCVYFPNRTGRLGMLRLALRALIGRLRQDRDFNALCTTELWIDTQRTRLPVALDGEVEHVVPPLHYRIRPKSLKVILPEPAPPPPQPVA